MSKQNVVQTLTLLLQCCSSTLIPDIINICHSPVSSHQAARLLFQLHIIHCTLYSGVVVYLFYSNLFPRSLTLTWRTVIVADNVSIISTGIALIPNQTFRSEFRSTIIAKNRILEGHKVDISDQEHCTKLKAGNAMC